MVNEEEPSKPEMRLYVDDSEASKEAEAAMRSAVIVFRRIPVIIGYRELQVLPTVETLAHRFEGLREIQGYVLPSTKSGRSKS